MNPFRLITSTVPKIYKINCFTRITLSTKILDMQNTIAVQFFLMQNYIFLYSEVTSADRMLKFIIGAVCRFFPRRETHVKEHMFVGNFDKMFHVFNGYENSYHHISHDPVL